MQCLYSNLSINNLLGPAEVLHAHVSLKRLLSKAGHAIATHFARS